MFFRNGKLVEIKETLEKLGYSQLNAMQEKAIAAGLLTERHFLACCPTASGKTLLALLRMVANNGKGKCVYIVPLRALAAEKHKEFSSSLASFGMTVGVSTGDFDSSNEELASFDVVVVTSEKMESLLRHKSSWLKTVSLAIADEIHLINDDGRGPTLEIVLTKLKETGSAVVGLSATIPNNKEVAAWLGAKLFESTYRPTVLEKKVACDGKLFSEEGAEKIEEKEMIAGLAKKALGENNGKGQVIVFVSTRRSTEAIAKQLCGVASAFLAEEEKSECEELSKKALKALPQPTSQCFALSNCLRSGVAFHHAGLVEKDRQLIERGFKEDRCVKVIVATTTLAMGIDFPASWVIVRDVKRFAGDFSVYLPNLEVQQMCLPGDAEILLSDGSYQKIGKLVENKQSVGIASVNETTGKLEENRPVDWFKNESDSLIKINLADGREIKVTGNHPLLKLNEYLRKPAWKRADAIEPGDLIAVVSMAPSSNKIPRMLDYFDMAYVPSAVSHFRTLAKLSGLTYGEIANKFKIPFKTVKTYAYNKSIPLKLLRELSQLSGNESYLYSNIKLIKTKGGRPLAISEYLSPDFLWLIGIIAAEGSVIAYTGKKRWAGVDYKKIKVANTDSRIIEKIKNILDGLETKYYSRKTIMGFGKKELTVLEICNQTLAKLILLFGITAGKKSYTVAPTEEIFRLPKEFVAQYIAGIFDGDGNFDERHGIRLCVKSKLLVLGLQKLLKKFDIRATTHSDKAGSWWLIISSLSEMTKFKKQIPCIRIKNFQGRNYKRETRPQKRFGDLIFEQIKWAETERLSSPQATYNLTIANNANYVCNDVLVHNCGRGGRPRFDHRGVGVICCSRRDLMAVRDKYILGPLENVYSKLSSEPALRMHTLSLVASDYCRSFEELQAFFSKTFFAQQYGATQELFALIEKIALQLSEWDFLREKNGKLVATPVGKRVSELYIDPLTAHNFVEFIKTRSATSGKPTTKTLLSPSFAMLLEFSGAIESKPLPRVGRHEEQALWEEAFSSLEGDALERFEFDRNAVEKWKNAKIAQAWVDEVGENGIMEKFDLPPGVLHARMRVLQWLSYSLGEIAYLMNAASVRSESRKLERRIKHGVKEELLDLVRVRGIGRVRARKLFGAGIANRLQLHAADKEKVKALLGEKIAERVLEAN